MVIEGRVRLAEYLAIHGYRELSRDDAEYPDAHEALCHELVKEVDRFGAQLRRLNYLAGLARQTLRVDLHAWIGDERLREVIDKLDRYGVAKIDGTSLCFANEQARFFANGGWLELYVYRVLERASAELAVQDRARGIRVESPAGSHNEIDVVFLAQNKLHLIECKARHMGQAEDDGPGAETLYKLDSLTAMGGLNTRGMLVSYQPINHYDRLRARHLRIEVVDGGALRNLDTHLRKWVSQ